MRPSLRSLHLPVFALLPLLLAGCSLSSDAPATPGKGLAIQGRVYGGQNPLKSAQVYLFAANSGVFTPNASGYGNASLSLLNSMGTNTFLDTSSGPTNNDYYVMTDSNGNFSISSDYTCTGGQQVYLYAREGDPGLGSGNNVAAGLLAALGTCPGTTGSTGNTFPSGLFVTMNEVSTIAAAYAFAGFATDATHVSSSGTALATVGIANAFASAASLETLQTGVALATTPQGSGTVPQTEINTLANILAACVNSSGAVTGPPSPTPCYALFVEQYGVLVGATQPTDTATAAINIAHNPWAFVSVLYGLQTGTAPFQPALTAVPNDFTIAISYTGSGLNGPAGLAVDASGDIWVADFGGSGFSKFGPTGAPLSGSGGVTGSGLNGPVSIAIDSLGDAWVTNYEGASISEFNPSNSPIAGTPYTLGGLDAPWGIAIDQSGHVWAANQSNNSISEFSSGGSPITGTGGITTGGLTDPSGVAIDVSGNVWVSNLHAFSVSEFNSGGTANANSPFSGGGLIAPLGIAVDGSGNIWASNAFSGTNSLSELNSSGSPLSPTSTGDTGGGLATPYYIAIDGAGNVWTPNYSGNSISEFTSAGTQICNSHSLFICPSGYKGGLNVPFAVAIDGAANVWVTNYGNATGNSITEFVGAAAAPVVTPIVANLRLPYGSHAVNLP